MDGPNTYARPAASCASFNGGLDEDQALREAIAALVSLVSSRTYASLSAGASFYVPRLAGKIAGLVPAAVIPPLVSTLLDVAGIDLPASGVVLVSRDAWDRHPLAVVAHELSHARRDATVAAGGVVASVLWGVGYLAHPDVRAWEESTCRINDLVGLVVIDGLSVDDALPTAAGGVDAYALDTPARALYLAALDSAAASLAVALKAEKLLVLTDVEGLFLDWPDSEDVIGEISPESLAEILPGLASGMVPKMGACLQAVENGVPRATVVDGREPHAVLLELFTREGVGTQVLPGVETKTRKARDTGE